MDNTGKNSIPITLGSEQAGITTGSDSFNLEIIPTGETIQRIKNFANCPI